MNKTTVISISVAGEICHITIRGRLVAGEEARALRDAILRAGPNFALVVVNVRSLDKVDAAGLGVLVFAYSTAQDLGARFRLAAVPPPIRELLSLTRLSGILMPQDHAERAV